MNKKFIETILLFILIAFNQSLHCQQNISGKWHGKLKSPMGEMQITISINSEPLSGPLSSSSGIKDIMLESVEIESNNFRFKIPSFGVSYSGKISKNKITGIWKQGQSSAELFFKKSLEVMKSRAQTPKVIEGYRSENVQFSQFKDQNKLNGTLTIPDGEGPFPAAILLSVAGPNDRDQTHGQGHKPFLVIADHLSKKGIAVLRYDDRGVGKSDGNLIESDFSVLRDDALSALDYLVKRKEIDSQKIGFIGNSEGTVIGALSAVKEKNVAFVIMIGAVGVPLIKLTADRLNRMQSMYKISEVQKKEIIGYYSKLDKIIKKEINSKNKRLQIEQLSAENTFDKPGFPNYLFFLPTKKEERVNLFLTPWYAAQTTYDPQEVLTNLKCPVLVMNGSLDVFQSPEQNFPAIQSALLKAGNKDFTLMVAPNVNHVMQIARTGFPIEYGKLENTVSPIILKTIASWIKARYYQ